MRKWSIRLIGCLFLLWALSESIDLLAGTRSAKGFYGISLNFSVGGIPSQFDIMAWIGIIIIVWTGYNLIRLEESGRQLALFLLLVPLIAKGIFSILIAISSANSTYFRMPMSLTFGFLNFTQVYEVDKPVVLLILLGKIIFYGSGIYFFSRKDTKILFQKSVTIQEKS